MNTDELTTHLHEATDGIELPPGFAATVARGGRRRQHRYRIAVATTATAALAVVGGGTYAMVTDSGVAENQIMAGWLAGPTKGDLAGDQQFLDEAVTAWETGKARSPNASAGVFDDLRGVPHVYWAGDTVAGRTAVVVQQAYLHPHAELPGGVADTLQTLVGLVATDPADGKFKLVGDQFQTAPGGPLPGSFLFGEKNEVLLVVDRGELLWENHIALGFEPGAVPTEEVLRSAWEPVSIGDGVAVEAFTTDPVPEFVVSGADPIATSAVQLPLPPATRYLHAAEAGGTGPLTSRGENALGWRGELRVGASGGPEITPEDVFFDAVAAADPNLQQGGIEISVDAGAGSLPNHERWQVVAGLTDGRTVVLGDYRNAYSTPYRFYAVLVHPDLSTELLTGDVVNRNRTLPVRFRLPDGQGWLVAAKGAPLSYRTTSGGAWQVAGTDAALVPDETTQVKVGEQVVDLPH
jgi:hypothetical protein